MRILFSFFFIGLGIISPLQAKTHSFQPFTGKLVANKVRVRAKPDLESPVIRQMGKNDLLLVLGEAGDFYAVEPMKDTKAYVFRSYILDGTVEADRVNVRLEPHVDAPIIGQLKSGDKIEGTVCAINHKWLEIAPPQNARFYVAKEFLQEAGGPEYLAKMQKRKNQLDQILSSAYLDAEKECQKNYEEMAPQQVVEQFQKILSEFADFPDACKQAKEGLALLKETYLNKKVEYLEARSELPEKTNPSLKDPQEGAKLLKDKREKWNKAEWTKKVPQNDQLGFWDTMEESLFLSWSAFHSGKTLSDYYVEQKANASVLKGVVARYTYDVRNKPEDFLLRNSEDAPIAYLYSTQVNLDEFEGKTVTLLASPRPNNHFAFPAYFVFSIE